MSDYTPTTEDMREVFVAAVRLSFKDVGASTYSIIRGVTHGGAWFDRWHAEEIRKAEHRGKQQAWVEGAAAAWLESGIRQFGAAYPTDNPTFIPFSLHNKNPYTEES